MMVEVPPEKGSEIHTLFLIRDILIERNKSLYSRSNKTISSCMNFLARFCAYFS